MIEMTCPIQTPSMIAIHMLQRSNFKDGPTLSRLLAHGIQEVRLFRKQPYLIASESGIPKPRPAIITEGHWKRLRIESVPPPVRQPRKIKPEIPYGKRRERWIAEMMKGKSIALSERELMYLSNFSKSKLLMGMLRGFQHSQSACQKAFDIAVRNASDQRKLIDLMSHPETREEMKIKLEQQRMESLDYCI